MRRGGHSRTSANKRQPMVLMHIIWMPTYRGYETGIYAGGFKYPKTHGWAGEFFNFKPFSGNCYGHVETLGRDIRLENLGAPKGAESVDNVLVVWTAPNPSRRGRTIVGWYKNARVYRIAQTPSGALARARTYQGNRCTFRVEARARDCVLLPIKQRVLTIPPKRRDQHGLPGQSALFYPALQRGHIAARIEERIRRFVEKRQALPLGAAPAEPQKPPRQPDVERRKRIEQAAVKRVMEYFTTDDYDVEDRSDDNLGYDLVAIRGDERLCIEVKGRSGNDVVAEFTVNEFSAIKDHENGEFHDGIYNICIVTDALDEGTGATIHHFTCWPDGKWRRLGGEDILRLQVLEAARGSLA